MHLGWVTSSGRSTYIICGYMVFSCLLSLCQLSLFYYSLDMETELKFEQETWQMASFWGQQHTFAPT